MQLRTTSQLPRLSTYPDNPESLVEVSEAVGESASLKYYSKAVTLGTVHDTIRDDAVQSAKEQFELADGNSNISLKKQKQRLDNITGTVQTSGQDTVFPGQKHFKINPIVDEPAQSPSPEQVPTVAQTKTIIKDNGPFIGQDINIYRARGSTAPQNASGGRFTMDDVRFMHFKIEDSHRESSVQSYDASSGATGQLVCYGWLSDKGDVPAQNAWVALCGYLGAEAAGDEVASKWVVLQLQPWIIGSKSQSLQYVGFNIPYKAGLRLKVMTGFPVDGSSTGFQTGSSLTLDSGWQPNTFIGYVLYY